MKNKLFTLLVCFVFAFTACKNTNTNNKENDSTSTEDTNETASNDEEETPQLSEEEINKIYMEYMTPSDMHKMIASTVGNWDIQTISYMGPQPDTTKGTASDKMIANGLYKETDYSGTMMGMPFMGKAILGYDNAKKKFVSTWVDNFGSGILMMEGSYDEGNKALTLMGGYTDPATKKEVKWKQVNTMVDDNTYTMDMYTVEGDKETKVMEQKATRKTGA